MIIIVVVDKLIAFPGLFPIKWSEKLLYSGALLFFFSADIKEHSRSWQLVLVISVKHFYAFHNLCSLNAKSVATQDAGLDMARDGGDRKQLAPIRCETDMVLMGDLSPDPACRWKTSSV